MFSVFATPVTTGGFKSSHRNQVRIDHRMFDISDNIDEFERSLSDTAQKQMPFALMLTINDTLKDVKGNREDDLDKRFKNPTPFTKRGIYIKRATKRRLSGEVAFKKIQAEYLELQVKGGIRKPKRKAIVVPKAIRLNKYGNMPRGSLARNISKSDTFVVNRGDKRSRSLAPGVYKRSKRKRGGKLKMLATFENQVAYKKRYDFVGPAHKTASGVLPKHMFKNIKRSVKTAR